MIQLTVRQKYRKNNKEKIKKYNKEYRQRPEIKKRVKEYISNNKPAVKRSKKKWRLRNREHLNEYKKKYNKTKRGHESQVRRSHNYWEKNKKKLKIKYDKYMNKTGIREYSVIRSKLWKKNNPEKVLIQDKKRLKKRSLELNISVQEYRWSLQSWSASVKKRDRKCKVCNSTKKLESHHILSKVEYPKLSLDLNNGVTFCNDCHYEYTWGVCK